MMTTSYLELNVVEIGAEAALMFEEKMMILFNDTVPSDLKEIAVIHDCKSFTEEVKAGDELVIDGKVFAILFVGDKANETLKELGHATFNFNGESNSELPGTICLEAKSIPAMQSDSIISFRRG